MKKKIELYLDGPTIKEITEFKNIDGYTFNPTLFRKLGAGDYINFSKKICKYTKNKPVSIEVFADDEINCYEQAIKISKISKNIFVKIPITYTNGDSTLELIKKLTQQNINLNITAIFTIEQIKKILPSISQTKTILSIFSGRLYDIGLDASELFLEMSNFVHKNSKCKTLWASSRMSYDFINAIKSKGDIITMSPDIAIKLNIFGKNPKSFSLETVQTFFNDAKKSGFKI